MFSTKTRCPICRSAKVRKPRRLAQGLFHRDFYCGGCGIKFRLPLLLCLFKSFSRPAPEAIQQFLPLAAQKALTPAFSPRLSYQPCLERTLIPPAEVPPLASHATSNTTGLQVVCAGKTFHIDFRIGNGLPYTTSVSSAESSLSRLPEVIRARWRWINEKTSPRRP
jgi:hypothetical protein